MIAAGDKVAVEAIVNFTDGAIAEIQIGENKYYVPVDLLCRVAEDVWELDFTSIEAASPPDLGVSVGDGARTAERVG